MKEGSSQGASWELRGPSQGPRISGWPEMERERETEKEERRGEKEREKKRERERDEEI